MLRHLFFALAAFVSTQAFSQSHCAQYNHNPFACQQDIHCSYDHRFGECLETDHGGGGGNRQCSSYDFDPRTCNAVGNCQFNFGLNRCEDRWTPGPNPNQQCWRYDGQPRLCDQQPNCSWDRRSNSCVDDWNNPGPGPGPRQPQYQTVRCESGDYRFQTCFVPGQVVSAYVLRQLSSSRCVQGQTFGFDARGLWVDRGCRAEFYVGYYPNFF